MNNPDWSLFLKEASGDIRRLSYVDRFSSIPVTLRENVAEHSFWVVYYSMLIHRELGGPEEALPELIQYATVHDLPECLTGDIVRTFKYSSSDLKRAIDMAEEEMVELLPPRVQSSYKTAVSYLEGDNGWYIGSVVKAADFLSLHQYMWRENLRGNEEIGPFLKRMSEDLVRMSTRIVREAPSDQNSKRYASSLSDLYRSMSSRVHN